MSDELNEIKEKKFTIKLNGKDRKIKFGFGAWGDIEEKFDGIESVMDALKKKPFTVIPQLLTFSIIREKDETITDENVIAWLDEYDDMDIQTVMTVIVEAITASIPNNAKGPRKAKAEK